MSPLVTVVIPSYNHGNFIRSAIFSVINQTYSEIELIIIDDGSSDESTMVIRDLTSQCLERFEFFSFIEQSNKGISATLKKSLAISKGKYWCYLSSDDCFYVDKITAQVNFLETNPNLPCVFGGEAIIDENNNQKYINLPKKRFYNFDEIFTRNHSILTSTHLIRKEVLDNMDPFQSGLYIDDLNLWLKISEKFGILHTQKILCTKKRIIKGQGAASNIEKMHLARLAIIKQYKNHTLYKKALAATYLHYAMDQSIIKKRTALKGLFKGLFFNPLSLLRLYFYKILLKAIIPKKLFILLRKSVT